MGWGPVTWFPFRFLRYSRYKIVIWGISISPHLDYNPSMPPLIKTNAYLSKPAARRAMLRRSALDSSVFEGARGLERGATQRRPVSSKARSMASAKRRASGS
jgi:hypothetical protein